MRDTGLERAPAKIEGVIAGDDIRWTMRVWRGRLRGKQHPKSIPA